MVAGAAPLETPVRSSAAGPRPSIDAYGLHRPDLKQARASVRRVCADRAEQIWAALLQRAGLHGDETEASAVRRMIEAMAECGDPLVALCSRALEIRLSSFEHLAATHTIVGVSQG